MATWSPKHRAEISPLGGPRALIGLSPAVASAKAGHWSDTNEERERERESLLFLGSWEAEGGLFLEAPQQGFGPNWKDTSVPSRDALLALKLAEWRLEC